MNNHQLEFGETKLKLSKFWLMLHNSFQIFGCVFILYRIFHEGPVADFTGVYSKEDTKIERIFKWLELAPFLELVHHLIGISKMKTHIFVGMLINIWILFGVIDYNPTSPYAMHWIIIRCVQKTIRHFYNAYSAMDLKFEVYAIDYIRMTAFYVMYPLEYVYSLVLVFNTLPKVKELGIGRYNMPNLMNFDFDYQLIYFFYICASLPNFINTFVYLHRKRAQQLEIAERFIRPVKQD